MALKFAAKSIKRSDYDQTSGQLELEVIDQAGNTLCLTLDRDVAAALADIAQIDGSHAGILTKVPSRYAVGHGRYEPYVMLRFENEPAYGLTPEQAADLAEALIEEAEAVSEIGCPATH